MRVIATSVMTHYAMTHYDFIMDIPSNIIAYYDVIMGHGTKKVVSTTDSHKSGALNGISTGDLVMEIPFKTGHSTAYNWWSGQTGQFP